MAKLIVLCKNGNLKKIQEFIDQALNKDVVQKELATGWGDRGYSPLHEAVLRSDHILLEYLLQWAKNPDCRAKDGSTPLQLAVQLWRPICVKALLLHRADCTPLHKLLREACRKGNMEQVQDIIKAILWLPPEDVIKMVLWFPSRMDSPHTVSHIFSTATWTSNQASRSQDLLDQLLDMRFGGSGYTVVHEATLAGHHQIVDYLLGQGGDVNCKDRDGCTSLHLAARWGHMECVMVLFHRKIDLYAKDKNGKTAMDVAVQRSLQKIARILWSEGIEIIYVC